MVPHTIQDPSPSPGAEEYLLGCVANLYSQVPSRIPDANDNDSFPSECHWVLIVSTVEVLSFELFDSRKVFQGQMSISVMASANHYSIKDIHLLSPFTLSDHFPLARSREIRPLIHTAHSGLEPDVL
jgi:hypothetical protein